MTNSSATRSDGHPITKANDSGETASLQSRPFAAIWSLAKREWLRFFRQRNRVIGAFGQPLLFWLLFGAGMNQTFNAGDISFRAYYFPGTMMLILLFTAIFTSISIIEDRNEGFLQGVLVSPIPRWAMVGGKVLGGASIALLQALLFFLLAFTLGIRPSIPILVAIVAWLSLTAVGVTAMGFVIAWKTDSTQGFHAVMSLLLLPMWLLSGAFFPVPAAGAQGDLGTLILGTIMRVNPMTYAMSGLHQLMFRMLPQPDATDGFTAWVPSFGLCLLVVLAFSLIMYGLAWRVSFRSHPGDWK